MTTPAQRQAAAKVLRSDVAEMREAIKSLHEAGKKIGDDLMEKAKLEIAALEAVAAELEASRDP